MQLSFFDFEEEQMETVKLNYGTSFTREDIEEAVHSGKNVVFSHPAGTGKTTAICEYIAHKVKQGGLGRKVIYIAPTKSLLDMMYGKLIEAGVRPDIIFNYHSSSLDYRKCMDFGKINNAKVLHRTKTSSIILITHERMKFDVAQKYLSEIDLVSAGAKTDFLPLVFLDESLEDCNIASMSHFCLDSILLMSGLIERGENRYDYLNKERDLYTDAKSLEAYLTTPCEVDKATGDATIAHLEMYGITLANNTGFGVKADMSDPATSMRFQVLYGALAKIIASKNWVEDKDKIYVNLPVAIHETWKKYAQIIVTDATAFIEPCFYNNFHFDTSKCWNSGLLTNYIYADKKNSRTKWEETPLLVDKTLDKINLKKYNCIYMVTFKGKIQDHVKKYLEKTYPDYTIETADSRTVDEFLVSDIDRSTDELYSDSENKKKIIYLTNFGRTRGSNKFRNCDCVIQIGNYRINPTFLNYLAVIYPGLTSNQLALTNYIQELYRGRIRLNQKMDSYAIVESEFYNYMESQLNSLGFKFDLLDKNNEKVLSYGRNNELVKFLMNAKLNRIDLTKEDILKICNVIRWEDAKQRICSLYKNNVDLQKTLFSKYSSLKELRSKLKLHKSVKFLMKLYS